MLYPMTTTPTDQKRPLDANPYSDARTLAAWCSRSDAGYNCGAWQTTLHLRRHLENRNFMREVAEALVELGLPDDHPAMLQWSRELA